MRQRVKLFILVGIVVLALLWYLLSPLFLNKNVSEMFPLAPSLENDSSGAALDLVRAGTFVDADSFHETSGNVFIVQNGDGTHVRFENFVTTNGPDLRVYLAKDLKAQNYVSLGDLKGNLGNQNYVVSEDIEVEEYPYVLIWCEAFSTLFGYASLDDVEE